MVKHVVSYGIEHKINMGNYEHLVVKAEVLLEAADGEDGDDYSQLMELARNDAHMAVKADLAEAARLTVLESGADGDGKSYVHEWEGIA